ncbi:CHASE2 domain-containing protein, partial [Sulfurimonas sp.]|nr:CHASE2 domain-containing protein [Sulfurimonas sp.]
MISNALATTYSQSKSSNVIVVDIDEKSLKYFGQWPWPRVVLAKVIHKVNSLHPSAIGIDVLFPEKDRTSPNEINAFYKNNFNMESVVSGIPRNFTDNDLVFSSALKRAGVVMGTYLSDNILLNKQCNPIKPLNLNVNKFILESSEYLLCNTPSLVSSAKYEGFVNTYIDEDAVLRRMPLLRMRNGEIIPTLSLATLLSIDENIYTMKDHTLNILNREISTDEKSNILLKFYDNNWYKKVSVIDLLNNKIPKEMITGKIVLLGSSAVSLHDQIIVTGGKKIIGVKVHVTM